MKIEKRPRYICEHCSRSWSKRKPCAEHEPRCWRNPARELQDGDLFPVPSPAPSKFDITGMDRVAWPIPIYDRDEFYLDDVKEMAGWEPIYMWEHDGTEDGREVRVDPARINTELELIFERPVCYLEGEWIPVDWTTWDLLAQGSRLEWFRRSAVADPELVIFHCWGDLTPDEEPDDGIPF